MTRTTVAKISYISPQADPLQTDTARSSYLLCISNRFVLYSYFTLPLSSFRGPNLLHPPVCFASCMFVSLPTTATKSISLARHLLTSRKVKRKIQHRRGRVGNIRLRLSTFRLRGFVAGRAAKYKIGETYLTTPCRPQISPPINSPSTILRSLKNGRL